MLGAIPGCGGAGDGSRGPGTVRAGAHTTAGAVSPQEARRLIAADSTLLVLDVRDPAEWDDDVGHIAQARLIPLGQLAGRLAEIERWKDRTIITVCRVGVRSHRAVELLESRRFRDARNLIGGMEAWRAAGY